MTNERKIRHNIEFQSEEVQDIMGKVATIDTEPDHKGNYHIEKAFHDGLVTTYGTKLSQEWTMTGSVEIVIEDKRLIEAFVPVISQVLKD